MITSQKIISPTVNHPFVRFSRQKPSQTIAARTQRDEARDGHSTLCPVAASK